MNTKNFSTFLAFLLLGSSPLCIHSSEEYFRSQLREAAHLRMQRSGHSNNLPPRQRSQAVVVTIADVKRNDWNEEKDQLEKRCILLMAELLSAKIDNLEHEMRAARNEIKAEMRFSDQRETLIQPAVIEEEEPQKINPFYAIYITFLTYVGSLTYKC